MEIYTSLAIVAIAALAHASFQLSISMLTLLSGHAIGKKRSHKGLLVLTNSFVLGAGFMTLLLLSLFALVLTYIDTAADSLLIWTVACGLLAGVGMSVAIFYYRKETGTSLWVPRGMARFLAERTKHTKDAAESFSLGITSVFAELLFIIAPLFIAALTLVELSNEWQVAGIAIYVLISLSSLMIVASLIGAGHSISKIQKWRETNKRFLQFSAGSGLILLAVYVYVEHVMLAAAVAAAGAI